MVEVGPAPFEAIVTEALDGLPDQLGELMGSVAVTVAMPMCNACRHRRAGCGGRRHECYRLSWASFSSTERRTSSSGSGSSFAKCNDPGVHS